MGYFVELLEVNIQKETSVERNNILEKYKLFFIFLKLLERQVAWNSNKTCLKMTKLKVICSINVNAMSIDFYVSQSSYSFIWDTSMELAMKYQKII